MIRSDRRRANARNVSFPISLRRPIHIMDPVDKTKLSWHNTKISIPFKSCITCLSKIESIVGVGTNLHSILPKQHCKCSNHVEFSRTWSASTLNYARTCTQHFPKTHYYKALWYDVVNTLSHVWHLKYGTADRDDSLFDSSFFFFHYETADGGGILFKHR